MPQPSIIGQPVASFQRLAVPSEAAMPPACEMRSAEKSTVLKSGCTSSALNSVFTAGSTWNGAFLSVAIKVGKSRGLGISVMCQPWRMPSRQTVSAKM